MTARERLAPQRGCPLVVVAEPRSATTPWRSRLVNHDTHIGFGNVIDAATHHPVPGPFADVPLDTLAGQIGDWGYQGVELCCWGDHLEVQRGLSDDGYSPARVALLARHDLQIPVIANHKVGQAVSDPIDARHQALLPDYVWGDGDPAGVRQRAAKEMVATFRLAEKLGAGVVGGFTGSPVWSYVTGYPAPGPRHRRCPSPVRPRLGADPRCRPGVWRPVRRQGPPRPDGVRPTLG